MAHADIGGAIIDTPVLDHSKRVRSTRRGVREWKFSLEGYANAITEVSGAQIVTKLPQGTELGVLPSHIH